MHYSAEQKAIFQILGEALLRYIVVIRRCGWTPTGSLSYIHFRGEPRDVPVDLIRALHGDKEAKERLEILGRAWERLFVDELGSTIAKHMEQR